MGLNKCNTVVKYTLLFVNLLFWVIGAATVILSIWVLVDQTFLVSLSQDQSNFYAGLYILLASGTIMLIIAFLGCCGAYKESQCILVTFFCCMLIIIVAQVATVAWLHVNWNRLEELVKSSVHTTIKNEYGVISSRTKIVDIFQQHLHCCGASSPNDWAGSTNAKKNNNPEILLTVSQGTVFTVPRSCCKDVKSIECEKSRLIRFADNIPSSIYSIGCTDQILKELKEQSGISLGFAISLGVIEFLCLFLSLILYCAIDSSDQYKS